MTTASPLTPTAPETNYNQITDVFWYRVCAFIVDSFIISVIINVLIPIFGVPQVNSGGDFLFPRSSFVTVAHVGAVSINLPWSYLVLVTYYFIYEWLFGATPGKRWFGLVVVTFDFTALSWWRALLRNLIRPLDYFLFIGIFLVRFERFHQRLGDRWASTIVVRREALAVQPISARQARSRFWRLLPVLVLLVAGCFAFQYFARPPLVIEGMFNLHQGPFSDAPNRSGTVQYGVLSTTSCVSSYTLGTPTRQGETITYPVTYHIFHGAYPDQDGFIMLRWSGFLGGGWQQAFSQGPTC